MAKPITRIPLTLFGGSGASTNFGQFGSQLAGTPLKTKDVALLQSLAAWVNGWQNAVASGNVPYLEDLNAIFYVHAYMQAYTLQEGIPEYDASTLYYIGSVVKRPSAGEMYLSLTDSNTGNALPTAGASNANWQFLYGIIGGIFRIGSSLEMNAQKITGLAAGTAGTDGVNFGQLSGLSNPNILINGGYDFWQRGTSFALGGAGGAYTTDRWSYAGVSGGAVTVSQEATTIHDGPYAMKINVTNPGAGGNMYFTQTVENFADYSGRTVSLGAWVKTTMSNVYVGLQNGTILSGVHPGDGAWHFLTVTTTLPNPLTFLNCLCPFVTTGLAIGIIYVDSVVLVIGSQAISYPRLYAAELALCQRYYQKSYDLAVAPGTASLIGATYGGFPSASPTLNEIDYTIRFQTPMRTAPTLVIYDMAGTPAKCNRIIPGAASTAAQAVTLNVAGSSGAIIFSSSGVSACGIGVHFTADAEL